jgi:hypothetical protein
MQVKDVIAIVFTLGWSAVAIAISIYTVISGRIRFKGGRIILRSAEPLKYWAWCSVIVTIAMGAATVFLLEALRIWLTGG